MLRPIFRPILGTMARALTQGGLRSRYLGPSLDLNFAANTYLRGAIDQVPTPQAFGSVITFTRASGGGRINSLGQFEWVGNDVPRLTHDPITLQPLGIIIEDQRTNLLTRSGSVANAVWGKAAVGATPAIGGPMGLPSELLVPTAGAGNHFYAHTPAVAGMVDNVTVTLSLFAKAAGYNHFQIQGKTKTNQFPAANFDLASGVATLLISSGSAQAVMTPFPDGWFRCSLTWNVLAGAEPLAFFLSPKPTAANSFSFTADGVSGAFVSAHQLELGASASSYIPTEASQVTRAADVCSVNTLSPWFNPLEGTLVVEGIPSDGSGVLRAIASLDDNTTANTIRVRHNGTTVSSGIVVAGNMVQAGSFTSAANSWPLNARRKAALSYRANAFAFSCSGEVAQTDTSGTVPVVTRLNVGQAPGNSLFNGTISRITYYPRVIDVQQASA